MNYDEGIWNEINVVGKRIGDKNAERLKNASSLEHHLIKWKVPTRTRSSI